jgi:hypothetical protein
MLRNVSGIPWRLGSMQVNLESVDNTKNEVPAVLGPGVYSTSNRIPEAEE